MEGSAVPESNPIFRCVFHFSVKFYAIKLEGFLSLCSEFGHLEEVYYNVNTRKSLITNHCFFLFCYRHYFLHTGFELRCQPLMLTNSGFSKRFVDFCSVRCAAVVFIANKTGLSQLIRLFEQIFLKGSTLWYFVQNCN